MEFGYGLRILQFLNVQVISIVERMPQFGRINESEYLHRQALALDAFFTQGDYPLTDVLDEVRRRAVDNPIS